MPLRLSTRSGLTGALAPTVAVLVIGAGAAVVVVDALDAEPRTRALLALVRTVALTLAGLSLRRQRRRGDPERLVWRAFGLGLVVMAAGSALDVAFRLVPWRAWGPDQDEALLLSVVVAAPLVYGGLVRWNRIRTVVTETSDWLNGTSAVFAAMALANLLLDGAAGRGGAGGWELQLDLLRMSLLTVLLGTTLTVAWINGFARDVRTWLLAVPCAVLVVIRAAVLVLDAPHGWWWITGGWVLLCLSVVVASKLPRLPVEATPARTRDIVVSMVVVLGVAVAVLAANALLDLHQRAGAVYAVVAVVGVVSRAGHLVRGLAHLAQERQESARDDLTGLATRKALQARTDRAVQRPDPVTLLVLDLDDFQSVNDRYGHRTGDLALAQLARRLTPEVPLRGVLARLSGDEFALLAPGLTAAEATPVAERVLAVCRAGVDVDSRHLELWGSIGIATSGGHDAVLSGDELARRADAAMWLAKARGGGVAVYDDDAARRGRGRALLAEELATALGGGASRDASRQFEVHYQPQVSTSTDQVVGVEALVRWNHPELGLLEPAQFLDIVEERDLMRPLTAHVARTATADLRAWARAGIWLRLSVNTSASCLTSPLMMPLVQEVLDAGTDPRQLVVEVTETTLMAEPDRALAVCHELTALGVGLSIDDYGTGYSSLAYLADLPVTELKIDRSFTTRVRSDPRIEAIVAGTVELAHHLGLRAVAEGVEDPATLARVRTLGCDESQGYWHSPALPARDLRLWLDARRADLREREPLH